MSGLVNPFFSGPPPFVGPLDAYTTNLWGAWSQSQLFTAFTSGGIQVRRSSDNTTTTPAFTAGGAFDSVAALAFVGGGNGTVRTWRDQLGGTNHLSCDDGVTLTTDPAIITSGSYLGNIQFDGSNDWAQPSSVTSSGKSGMTFFWKGKSRNASGTYILIELGSDFNNLNAIVVLSTTSIIRSALHDNTHGGTSTYYSDRDLALTAGVPLTVDHVWGFRWDVSQGSANAQVTIWIDGVKQTTTDASTPPVPTSNLSPAQLNFAARNKASLNMPINASTLLIYQAAMSDADMAAISALVP